MTWLVDCFELGSAVATAWLIGHAALGFGFSAKMGFWKPYRGASGAKDLSFGTNGLATYLIEGSAANGRGIALQTDNKLVATGEANGDFFVSRLNADGSLDTDWSGDGVVRTDIMATANEYSLGVAVSPVDGKVVVGGYSIPAAEYFAVALYNTNGTLDTGFDTDGIKTFQFSAKDSKGKDIVFQSDGKIVISGESDTGTLGAAQVAVARLTTAGAFDTTFATTGLKLTDINGGIGDDKGHKLTIAPDGAIMVAAATLSGFYYAYGAVRYLASNGSESGLDGDGKITTDMPGTNDYGLEIAVNTANTKFAIAGQTDAGTWDSSIAMYNINGTLDTGFNSTGKLVVTSAAGTDAYSAVAFQADGKLVVAGYQSNGTNNDMVVARYNTNGTLDTTFGGTGKLVEDSGGTDVGVGLLIDGEGRIVVVGTSNGNFAVWRYWN